MGGLIFPWKMKEGQCKPEHESVSGCKFNQAQARVQAGTGPRLSQFFLVELLLLAEEHAVVVEVL